MPHQQISPAIFYWGTPIVLITTLNADGTSNIAPMSSAWWLGNRCMLGLAPESHTTQNLLRTKECVLNLASDNMSDAINALAKTTRSSPVPPNKLAMGYRYESDKFGVADLTPVASEAVATPRIHECPVQMECRLVRHHTMMDDLNGITKGVDLAIEVEVLRTYVADEIRMDGYANRVDPDKWRPMIMSFQKMYGLRDGQVAGSKLAEIDEEFYRGSEPSR